VAGRLKMMLARAVVNLVDDGRKMQSIQVSVLHEEVKSDVERFQQYGFTSHPHAGAEALMVCLGGNRDHAIVVSVDDRRYRLKLLEAGEVALYDDLGQKVVLKRDMIEATSPTRIDAIAPDVRLGDPVALERAMQKLVDARFKVRYDGHRHDNGGGSGLSGPVTSSDHLVIDDDTTEHTKAV